MINRRTVGILGLKPMTRDMCYDFYVKINSECENPEAIRESVTWWQTDKGKLNHLWWVLNYYSDRLDPDRNLRAFVEKYLDILAEEAAFQAEQTESGASRATSGKLAV